MRAALALVAVAASAAPVFAASLDVTAAYRMKPGTNGDAPL